MHTIIIAENFNKFQAGKFTGSKTFQIDDLNYEFVYDGGHMYECVVTKDSKFYDYFKK